MTPPLGIPNTVLVWEVPEDNDTVEEWLHHQRGGGRVEVRVPQRDYNYDGYLSDISLAWECFHAAAQRQIFVKRNLRTLITSDRF